MGKFRFYLAPTKEQITFGYPYNSATMDAPFYPEVEISDHIMEDSFTSIDQSLDDPKHLGGILTFSNFKLEVNNSRDIFGVGASPKLFPWKINGSRIRIEWDDGPSLPICGSAIAICGDVYIVRTRKIFEGLIWDEPLEKDSDFDILQFQVLGYLSFIRESGNFTYVPGHGNTHCIIAQIFMPLLERGIITHETGLPIYSTNLSDYTDWARDHNQPEVILVTPPPAGEKNLFDLLNDMIGICGGYIYFEDNKYLFRKIVFDSARPDFQFEAFNQNSNEGIENITEVSFKAEFDRIYSKIIWDNDNPYPPSPRHYVDAADPDLYGIKEYKIDYFDYVKTTAEADKVLDRYKNEFKDKKYGYPLEVPLTADSFEPKFLESIQLHVPPRGTTGLASSAEKIALIVLGKKIDMKKEMLIFYLRNP